MQDFIARNYRLGAILALALFLALLGYLASLIASNIPTQDELAVRQVCQDAVKAQQTLPIPPGSYKGGAMSEALVQQMQSRIASTLNSYYIGNALGETTTRLQKAILVEKGGVTRYLGGDINSMTFSKVTVKNNIATVSAEAALWANIGQVKAKHLTSSIQHHRVDYIFTLVRTNGHWRINEEQSKVLA